MILLYVLNICYYEPKLIIKTASKQLLDSLWTTNFIIRSSGYIFPQHNRTCSSKIYISISKKFGCAIFLSYTANTLNIRL